jgi:hypothetical protein
VPWAVRALRRGVRVVDGVGGYVEPPLRGVPQVRQGPRPQPLQRRGLVKIEERFADSELLMIDILLCDFRMKPMIISPNSVFFTSVASYFSFLIVFLREDALVHVRC